MTKRTAAFIIAVLLIIVSAGWLGYRYYHNRHTPAPATPTTSQSDNQTTSPPTSSNQPNSSQPQTYAVKVFFSKHPDSDNDPSKVFVVSRTSPDLGVGSFSIAELLKGPSSSEKDQGYFTTARLRADTSNCNGQDFTLKISSNNATLQFCRTFDHLGVVADGQAESEINATLKQFSSVQKVIILNRSGDCEFNLSGMNLCKN